MLLTGKSSSGLQSNNLRLECSCFVRRKNSKRHLFRLKGMRRTSLLPRWATFASCWSKCSRSSPRAQALPVTILVLFATTQEPNRYVVETSLSFIFVSTNYILDWKPNTSAHQLQFNPTKVVDRARWKTLCTLFSTVITSQTYIFTLK